MKWSCIEVAAIAIPSITVYSRRTVPEIASTQAPSLSPEERHEVVCRLRELASASGYRDLVDNPALECQHFVRPEYTPVLPEYRTRYTPAVHNSCLGIGDGASSFITDAVHIESETLPGASEALHTVVESSAKDRMRAFVVNMLYSRGTLPDVEFAARFEQALDDVFARELRELRAVHLLEDGGRLAPSARDTLGRAIALKFFYRPAFVFEQLGSRREGDRFVTAPCR